MTFSVGDHVRPIPGWDKDIISESGRHSALPSGRVVAVEPWGKGQVIQIEGHRSKWCAGCFEHSETMTAHADETGHSPLVKQP